MICVPDGATHSQGPNFTEEPGLGKAAGPRPTPTGTNRHPEKDPPMSTTELPTDADSPVETPSPPVEEAVPADNADGDVPDLAEDVAADAAVSTPRSRRLRW